VALTLAACMPATVPLAGTTCGSRRKGRRRNYRSTVAPYSSLRPARRRHGASRTTAPSGAQIRQERMMRGKFHNPNSWNAAEILPCDSHAAIGAAVVRMCSFSPDAA